jgi:uncharacterized protein (TIGR02117 family)
VWRAAKVLIVVILAALVAVAGVAFATMRDSDPRLFPALPGEPDVRVIVADHGWHAGLILSVSDLAAATGTDYPLVRALAKRFHSYEAVEIGWGDEAFYRFAPAISDLDVGMAANALLGLNDSTVLHIAGFNGVADQVFSGSNLVELRLSQAGFERLVTALEQSLVTGMDGEPVELGQGVYGASLFIRANGHYSLLMTCNRWLGNLLAAAGVPVSPAPSTLSSTLMIELRWRAGGA